MPTYDMLLCAIDQWIENLAVVAAVAVAAVVEQYEATRKGGVWSCMGFDSAQYCCKMPRARDCGCMLAVMAACVSIPTFAAVVHNNLLV